MIDPCFFFKKSKKKFDIDLVSAYLWYRFNQQQQTEITMTNEKNLYSNAVYTFDREQLTIRDKERILDTITFVKYHHVNSDGIPRKNELVDMLKNLFGGHMQTEAIGIAAVNDRLYTEVYVCFNSLFDYVA
ncbi:MAG: hypothetical protein EBR93_02175 [Bacteroidetes bacterium]|nr:hypothetical protein [Bacteroidota bacterium]